MNTVTEKTCRFCQKTFGCGNPSQEISCWCNALPPLFSLDDNADCLCPDCLKKEAIKKIDKYVATITPKNSKNNLAATLPKTANLIEGIDFYNENGNRVFTKWFRLKQGECCNAACENCPYN